MQGYNIVVDGWAGASNSPHYGQTNRRTVGQMDNDSYKVRNKDRNGAKKGGKSRKKKRKKMNTVFFFLARLSRVFKFKFSPA